jgi:hypothetical protein
VITSVWAACYNTPRTAIDALKASPSISLVPESNGYRVTGIQSDPVLGQRWAMITNCSHPGWPVFALRADGESLPKAPQKGERSLAEVIKTAPLVRVGDIVLLWRQENLLRIEVAGVSEESGDLGKTIRVRLLRRNTDDQSIVEQFFGVVRGPSNVEIQQ